MLVCAAVCQGLVLRSAFFLGSYVQRSGERVLPGKRLWLAGGWLSKHTCASLRPTNLLCQARTSSHGPDLSQRPSLCHRWRWDGRSGQWSLGTSLSVANRVWPFGVYFPCLCLCHFSFYFSLGKKRKGKAKKGKCRREKKMKSNPTSKRQDLLEVDYDFTFTFLKKLFLRLTFILYLCPSNICSGRRWAVPSIK